MEKYFSFKLLGDPFKMFSTEHSITIAIIVLCSLLLFLYRERIMKNESLKHAIRYGIILLLIVSEVSLNVWYVFTDSFDMRYSLPFQLCSISVYLSTIMLFTKKQVLFEIVYFAGIGGALMAILTPELFYSFPHYRFMHFFIAHAAILLACFYMVWVEKRKPTLLSLAKSFVFVNIMAMVAFIVNIVTGGNYMFVGAKPTNGSIIDFLGPYPWYILSLEVVVIVYFSILYLPYLLLTLRKQKVVLPQSTMKG